MKLTLNVNGESRSVDVPADMPLLWVLRDVLDLKGTKFGCGIGQCGACTVHVDGAPIALLLDAGVGRRRRPRSPPSRAVGATAIGTRCRRPGSSSTSPQCGYCQAGQIMSAAALLAKNAEADRRGHRRRDERQHLPLRAPTRASAQAIKRAAGAAADDSARGADACHELGVRVRRHDTEHLASRVPHGERRSPAAACCSPRISMPPIAAASARRRRPPAATRAERLHHASRPTASSRSSPRTPRSARASRRCCRC